ncbi:ubiquinol-cytochrome c reductase iron-sulfur subunit [Bacteroidota bacterium]
MKDYNNNLHSRRDFIKKLPIRAAAFAGILASISLLRQFYPRLTRYQKRFKIGRKNNFPVNTFTYLRERKLFIYRDHEGVRAVSAVCTHLGCIIEKSEDGFQCPCHGSCYNEDGEVLSGAATKDLPWYSMQKDVDGQLVVDQGSRVDPEQKLYI